MPPSVKSKPNQGANVEPKKEVATVQAGLPASMEDMEKDAQTGVGFEGVGIGDIAIPYLTILQSGSPQVKLGNPAKIKDAKEGDLFNTVTQKLMDGEKGVRIVPVAFKKTWNEWVDRDNGGGFVKAHDTDALMSSCTKGDKGENILPNGNILVETAQHYVLLIEDGAISRAVISMKGTQLKKSRNWNAQMQNIQFPRSNGQGSFVPPPFSHSYLARTTPESKNDNSWVGWLITEPVRSTADAYRTAMAFNGAINSGSVKVATPHEDGEVKAKQDDVM